MYTLQFLWHGRAWYFPGVIAVTFSTLLVSVQWGLLLGLFDSVAKVIDQAHADVWIGSYRVASVDQAEAMPERWMSRLIAQPEVEWCEQFVLGREMWHKRNGAAELCVIIGSRLEADALGAPTSLTQEIRNRLSEPGAVVVDEADLPALGITYLGDTAEVSGRRVRVVGLVRGLKGQIGANIWCSIPTAQMLLGLRPDQSSFFLARCRKPEDAAALAKRFRGDDRLSVFTSQDFSLQSRLYWLTKTKVGLAVGWAALLGLLVGVAITAQTLYAAVAASLPGYALLRAMGIPRRCLAFSVILQTLGIGLMGTVLALPAIFLFVGAAALVGADVFMPFWLLGCAVLLTLVVTLFSGLGALRLVLSVDPIILLH